MTWQPIATCPKDGTQFLAWDSRTKKMDVCANLARPQPSVAAVQFDGEYGPGEDEFGYNESDITDWMPLPEPPVVAIDLPDDRVPYAYRQYKQRLAALAQIVATDNYLLMTEQQFVAEVLRLTGGNQNPATVAGDYAALMKDAGLKPLL